MAKYLRGLDNDTENDKDKCGYELSKWLESAAKFTPEKNNYIEWNLKGLEIGKKFGSPWIWNSLTDRKSIRFQGALHRTISHVGNWRKQSSEGRT